MDVDPVRRIEQVIRSEAGPGLPERGVLVEIEPFFDGNDEIGSIAPNLDPDADDPSVLHPGLDAIRRRLVEVRDRPDVDAVLIDVMVEYETYPDGEWPYAQSVQVVTTAAPATVDTWLDGLNPDPSFTATDRASWVNPPDVPAGHHIVTVWWD